MLIFTPTFFALLYMYMYVFTLDFSGIQICEQIS